MSLQQRKPKKTGGDRSITETESIVVRNHNQSDTRTLRITLRSATNDILFDRAISVTPLSTVSIQTEFDRDVYDVTVQSAVGTASAECLISDRPSECALVETGNGIVSVIDGL
jgi:hypothetical protein